MTGAPIPAGATAVIPVEYTDDDWQKGEASPPPANVKLFRALHMAKTYAEPAKISRLAKR